LELIERSCLRLLDVEHSEEGIAGEGSLVKLFPVSYRSIRSVGGSTRVLWIVGTPKANSAILKKLEDAQEVGAKASKTGKAGRTSKRTAKVKLMGAKAVNNTINAFLVSVRLSDALDVKRFLSQMSMRYASLSAVGMFWDHDPVIKGFDTVSRGRVIFVTLIYWLR
jgi:hypothetical protein